jgi:hypothetical protein
MNHSAKRRSAVRMFMLILCIYVFVVSIKHMRGGLNTYNTVTVKN